MVWFKTFEHLVQELANCYFFFLCKAPVVTVLGFLVYAATQFCPSDTKATAGNMQRDQGIYYSKALFYGHWKLNLI